MTPRAVVSLSMMLAILGLSCEAAAQQGAGTVGPSQMLSRLLPGKRHVMAKRSAEGGSELRIRDDSHLATVPVPYSPVTAVAVIGEDLLVAGVLPSGDSEYRLVQHAGGEWELSPTARVIPGSYPLQMSWKDGLLAMLLSDGRVIAAPCSGGVPDWGAFDLIGTAPSGVVRMGPLAGFNVLDATSIEVYAHPSHRPRFELQPSGEWQFDRNVPKSRKLLEVAKPARIGGEILYSSTSSGPIFLEEEGLGAVFTVSEEQPPSGRGAFPVGMSQMMRADRRYRLRANDVTGPWFYPAAITGRAWYAAGVTLEEVRVFEAGVRRECGAVSFRMTLDVLTTPAMATVFHVALLTISADAAPPVTHQNDRTWLVPAQALMVEKPLIAGRKSHALTASVPVPAAPEDPEKWIHIQFVVLAANGDKLGATGVRSVPIVANRGDGLAASEQERRAHATTQWATHGVGDVGAFLEQLILQ